MPELPFQTSLFTLTDNTGTVLASNIRAALDPVNIPLNLEVQGNIPTDWFDLYSDNWPPSLALPVRGNYFIDQATQAKYSVFGRTIPYPDHIEVRIALPLGVTP